MSLEETAKETVWIFRYLRADLEEIDMGPYATEQEAQKSSDTMASFGATCSGAIGVPKDYKLYKGGDE